LNQEDSGGLNTSAPDGIGDVCQCGDVNNDGLVNDADNTVLSRSLVDLSPYFNVVAMPGFNKCVVRSGGACNTAAKSVISRALVNLPPGIQQACPAATQWSPIGGGPGSAPPPQCVSAMAPTIPYAEGWLGSDGGASLLLPDNISVIWLFGDSFIGQAGAADRTNAVFPHNSIGISACPSQTWGAMDHYWGQIGTNPLAFFNPYATDFWDWPAEAFSYGSNVYVLMQRAQFDPTNSAFPFSLVGSDLAIVSTSDPMGSWTNPAEWTQQVISLNKSPSATLASSAVQPGDGYVYIYTSLPATAADPFDNPIILVRAPLQQLSDIVNQLQYFSVSQVWKSVPVDGTTTWESDAKVMFPAAAEMSVRWHGPPQNEWIAVYTSFASGWIMMLTAPSTSPTATPQESLTWSTNPKLIYQIPEMNPMDQTGQYDPNAWCYAVREHIEWATTTSMVATYACNYTGSSAGAAGNLAGLKTSMNLYHPVPVRIPLP
jgi:hypothetical protein